MKDTLGFVSFVETKPLTRKDKRNFLLKANAASGNLATKEDVPDMIDILCRSIVGKPAEQQTAAIEDAIRYTALLLQTRKRRAHTMQQMKQNPLRRQPHSTDNDRVRDGLGAQPFSDNSDSYSAFLNSQRSFR